MWKYTICICFLGNHPAHFKIKPPLRSAPVFMCRVGFKRGKKKSNIFTKASSTLVSCSVVSTI